MEASHSKSVRLFFAFLPDESCKQAIKKSLSGLPAIHGRRVPMANHHITLIFLGNIEEDRVPCLLEQASKLSFRSFSFVLDHLGSFKRARVLWMGMSGVPRGMLKLHKELSVLLKHCDFQPEQRKYRPHLTLYRKFSNRLPEVDIKPVRWEVRSFHLMISESTEEGVRYRSLATFTAR